MDNRKFVHALEDYYRRIASTELEVARGNFELFEAWVCQWGDYIVWGCAYDSASQTLSEGMVAIGGSLCLFSGASGVAGSYPVEKRIVDSSTFYRKDELPATLPVSGVGFTSAVAVRAAADGLNLLTAPRFVDVFRPKNANNADKIDGVSSESLVQIQSNGNVGIGTSSPSTKLEVVGAIQATNEWFYSTGNRGWINTTHGGGIYMIDSEFIRIYGDKQLYVKNNTDATNGIGEGDGAISTPGGISVGKRVWANGDIRSNSNMYAQAYNTTSDEKLKSNIEKVDTTSIKNVEFKQYIKDGKKEYGVIAQEVQKHIRDAVSGEDILNVNYSSILSAKCAQYEEELAELRKELAAIKSLLLKT